MVPVILSGGGGSRLWPVSRQAHPKQFSDLLNESLFNKTAKRLKSIGKPWVITVREMQTLTERSLRELGLPIDQTIYEPFGKNTAAAVALLCKRFELLGLADEVVGVFPADHLIDDEAEFLTVVRAGEALAKAGNIVTLGIRPTFPATGYGYIETEGKFGDEKSNALKATSFREKPNEETAREFLGRGCFYWNAGMFIFRVNTMIEMFSKYAPEIWRDISKLNTDLSNLEDIYKIVRNTSIDYAIMERLPSHVCLPCVLGWSDLGSWDSISEILGPGGSGVQKVEIESSDNFVYAAKSSKIYAFVGTDDLIVVDTPDALLVTRKGESENVKRLVEKLKAGPGGGKNVT